MKKRKSCWTCIDRRVRCDGGLPTCKSCARLGRCCQGYGVRLSWPQKSDRKRSIVGRDAPTDAMLLLGVRAPNFFVNTTWADMKMYWGSSPRTPPFDSLLSALPQFGKNAECGELFEYFQDQAYKSLVTLDKSKVTPQLRDVLVRMALSDRSVSGLSVFFSLLAYSSLHRNGLQVHAVDMKVMAVRMLTASLGDDSGDARTAAQQVATSMLLTAFDILSPSEGPREWLWHVWGANDIIRTSRLEETCCVDNDVLVDWVYYHNALSQFAVRYWRDESLLQRSLATTPPMDSMARQNYEIIQASKRPECEILNLLSEACLVIRDAKKPGSTNEFARRVEDLSQRIRNVSLSGATGTSTLFDVSAIEIYKLATTIYLVRTSQQPTEPTPWLDSLIESAFQSHMKACTCPHFFPLLILACEARSDERRLAVLQMLERINQDNAIRSIDQLRGVIYALWAQQDLSADVELLSSYTSLLETAISSSDGLPSFA